MMKKIFKATYYLIIAAIAVVALFLIFSAIPIKGGYKTFVVLSGSMEPKIHTGSVVAIRSEKSYSVGDVITFGENTKTKSPTTHRIAEIKNENGNKIFVTKGDANNAPDLKTVTEKEILGKVLFSVPYVGYAVAKAKTPIGFLLIVIIPAVIIIYEEIRNITAEIKKHLARRKKKKGLPEERVANVSFHDENKPEKNTQPAEKPFARRPRKIII